MSEHRAQTCANREHVNILEVELVQGTEHENPLDDMSDGFAETTAKKFHFFPRHDLMMLRQVLADQPFLAPHGQTEVAWNRVTAKLAKLGLRLQMRTVRERVKKLIQKFRSDEIASMRKSGTNEEYEERERLLTDIVEMIDGAAAEAKKTKEKQAASLALASQMRDTAMRTLREKQRATKEINGEDSTDTDEADAKPRKKRCKRTLTTILDERSERIRIQSELERKRLENETRRIALDEQKHKLERDRFDEDARARQAQTTMLTTLIEKLSEKRSSESIK